MIVNRTHQPLQTSPAEGVWCIYMINAVVAETATAAAASGGTEDEQRLCTTASESLGD